MLSPQGWSWVSCLQATLILNPTPTLNLSAYGLLHCCNEAQHKLEEYLPSGHCKLLEWTKNFQVMWSLILLHYHACEPIKLSLKCLVVMLLFTWSINQFLHGFFVFSQLCFENYKTILTGSDWFIDFIFTNAVWLTEFFWCFISVQVRYLVEVCM